MGRKHRLNTNGSRTPEKVRRRVTPIAVVVVLAVVDAACLGVPLMSPWNQDASAAAPPPAQVRAAGRPAAAVTPNAGSERLKGKWLRVDGGYVIEVRNVEGGKMDASYFNPRSINVYRAEASRDGTTTKVFIELRDVNYPGSTYALTYDAQQDRLTGTYYHAGLGQSFDVNFVRMK